MDSNVRLRKVPVAILYTMYEVNVQWRGLVLPSVCIKNGNLLQRIFRAIRNFMLQDCRVSFRILVVKGAEVRLCGVQ